MRVGRRRGHAFSFIDDQAGQVAVALVKIAQLLDQLLVAVPMCPCAQDALRRVEELRWNDALERAFLLDPHLGAVDHPMLLELEGAPVVDVVADVFLVGQHLAHGGARPVTPEVSANALGVEPFGDLRARSGCRRRTSGRSG
jgi:hypothetical protein